MERYEKYKDSGVEWIGEIPEGWEVKLVEVDGRRLVFEVEAHDGIDLITRGRHERFIINKDKFDRKMKNKSKKMGT